MEQMFDQWDASDAGDGACWNPLPDGLEELTPGRELAAMLASVDRARLSGFDRVVLLQARARQVAHDQAEFYADMMAVAEAVLEALTDAGEDEPPGEAYDYLPDEIRAALRWTRRMAETQLGLAWELSERLPRVGEALRRGEIDLPRARVICQETCHLGPDVARRVADEALERASGQTTGQLRARLQRLCITADPEGAHTRYEAGLAERRVVIEPQPDGTADLAGFCLPAERARAAWRRIGDLARAAKVRHDARSLDQIRADVFLDLLEGRAVPQRGGSAGVVDLHVDLVTLAGLSERPGDIPGWGPVIAEVARKVAAQAKAQWRVTVSSEGEVVWSGITRRRPTPAQRRFLEARYPTCVFPGCRMPARSCDLDHHLPWSEGGPTAPWNLGPFCRHHHRAKHHGGWKVERSRPGMYLWTSPLGHRYAVRVRGP